MAAYYNEIDPFAAEWLRNLIKAGLIADGDVDERSIEDVRAAELSGFTQCHFFAGIGVWSLALRRAGWADDRQVWTGSCPCQPFSAAGKRKGTSDERHLWPKFHDLIAQCSPGVVFGEQVASKDGLAWLDSVQTDLEKSGYASAAIDLCAAGFGAPHIRQRIFWVGEITIPQGRQGKKGHLATTGVDDGLAYADSDGCFSRSEATETSRQGYSADSESGTTGTEPAYQTNGFWRNPDWLFCQDGKFRPVESGTSPLVDGATSRVGRLRAYGNAIIAPVAQGFIEAYMES